MAKKTLSFEAHAAKYQLDEEEQNLLREIEDGEWGLVQIPHNELKILKQICGKP